MSTLNDQDRANLVAYLDGELDAKTSAALEAKIHLDASARAEVESLRQTWGMLDYLPKPAPSTSFTNRTMERLSLERMPVATGRMPIPASAWWRNVPWAAAVLAAALGGFGLANLIWPRGKDFAEEDAVLVRHLRVIEKLPQYQGVEDLDFLLQLDHPELFGEEGS